MSFIIIYIFTYNCKESLNECWIVWKELLMQNNCKVFVQSIGCTYRYCRLYNDREMFRDHLYLYPC